MYKVEDFLKSGVYRGGQGGIGRFTSHIFLPFVHDEGISTVLLLLLERVWLGIDYNSNLLNVSICSKNGNHQTYSLDWTETTNTIDYAIADVKENESKTSITLFRKGRIPMPIDIVVEYNDGTKEYFYIPLRMMFLEKENPYPQMKRTVLSDWAWAFPTYEFSIAKNKSAIKSIKIDPSGLMADVKPIDNVFPSK